jgi:hypothetical protein
MKTFVITITRICGKVTMLVCVAILIVACANDHSGNKKGNMEKGTFGYDRQFLEEYTDVVLLSGKDSLGSILVTPTMQGRVMTSTVNGVGGKSLGWVNHELIESGEIREHFTPYGGEDRFWIGPEGGQYSVFIQPGKEMVFENWFVPAGFNTEPWKLVSQSGTRVTVEKQLNLTNYSETEFDLQVTRSVELFDRSQIEKILELQLPEGIKQVGYVSENTIENTGNQAWTRETGAPAIWILSMFAPAPGITVAIPYKEGSTEELGPVVTTEYFGEISSDRLKIDGGIIYFKVDGKKRRKLGVSPLRALPVAGSYDETNNILTIINYTIPENYTDYVNQLWKQQDEPYKGNIVFAYNDGPLEDGSQLGPFYELESSSPAAFLEPDESLSHDHRVFHFTGDEQALNQISEDVLGVTLNEITSAF